MKQAIELITPQVAQEMLDRNFGNRKFRLSGVRRWAGAMKRGEWLLSPQGLQVDANGNMSDGQHRLRAVVETGMSIPMIVWRDVPVEMFAVTDIGIPRSMADTTKIPQKEVQVLKFFFGLRVNGQDKTPTAAQIHGVADIFRQEVADLLEFAPTASKAISQVGARAAIVILAKEGQQERAFDLYRRVTLSNLEGLPPSVLAVVKQILKGTFSADSGGRAQTISFCKVLFAFDKKNEGRTSIPAMDFLQEKMIDRATRWLK